MFPLILAVLNGDYIREYCNPYSGQSVQGGTSQVIDETEREEKEREREGQRQRERERRMTQSYNKIRTYSSRTIYNAIMW